MKITAFTHGTYEVTLVLDLRLVDMFIKDPHKYRLPLALELKERRDKMNEPGIVTTRDY